jgi:hypothetical protein
MVQQVKILTEEIHGCKIEKNNETMNVNLQNRASVPLCAIYFHTEAHGHGW